MVMAPAGNDPRKPTHYPSFGASPLEVKFATIGTSASGDTTLVAAVSGKKIRVLTLDAISKAALDIYFKDGAGAEVFGKAASVVGLQAGGGFILPHSPTGHFETASGQALLVNLSGSTALAGSLSYVEV